MSFGGAEAFPLRLTLKERLADLEDLRALSACSRALREAAQSEHLWAAVVSGGADTSVCTAALCPVEQRLRAVADERVLSALVAFVAAAGLVTGFWYLGFAARDTTDVEALSLLRLAARAASALALLAFSLAAAVLLDVKPPWPRAAPLLRRLGQSRLLTALVDAPLAVSNATAAAWARVAASRPGANEAAKSGSSESEGRRYRHLLHVEAAANWRAGRCSEWVLENVRGKPVAVNERFLVELHAGRELVVYEPARGAILFKIPCESSPSDVAVTRRWLIAAYLDQQGPRVWDLTSRRSVFYGRQLLRTSAPVTALAVVDEGRVMCAELGGNISLWELETHTRVSTLHHGAPVTAVATLHTRLPLRDAAASALLPAPQTVIVTATRSRDRGAAQLHIWLLAEPGSPVRTLGCAHNGPVAWLCPNALSDPLALRAGRAAAAAGRVLLLTAAELDSAVHLWDLRAGLLLRRFELHAAPVTALAWSGPRVISADAHGALLLWEIELSELADGAASAAKARLRWRARLGEFAVQRGALLADASGLLCQWGTSCRFLDFRTPGPLLDAQFAAARRRASAAALRAPVLVVDGILWSKGPRHGGLEQRARPPAGPPGERRERFSLLDALRSTAGPPQQWVRFSHADG